MGIALGYAFLLAIAGGLAAICLAYFLELVEDGELPADHEDSTPGQPAPSFEQPPLIIGHAGPTSRLQRIRDRSQRPALPHLFLTPK